MERYTIIVSEEARTNLRRIKAEGDFLLVKSISDTILQLSESSGRLSSVPEDGECLPGIFIKDLTLGYVLVYTIDSYRKVVYVLSVGLYQ